MLDWSCCDPAGRCVRGPGCPAGKNEKPNKARAKANDAISKGCGIGPNCFGRSDCGDHACPGHPGAGAAKAKSPQTPSLLRSFLAHWRHSSK
jgi:hypothetical protein